METREWTQQEIDKFIKESKNFRDQSFYQALQDTTVEQFKRIEQLQGEVDGRAWNTEKW
ncbi:hypothetical protein [Paucilactobacillus kaifaensis]|uniref:hypothetical protein n=1 Tax=Paucilactobacillus kaifaensis TaxID=2559921 RepID=UPI0014850393|nr:hypothetical protein [Paucilactobacillus kaifaensis]